MTELYVTRFTDDTLRENQNYCPGRDIYNSPVMISKNVQYGSNLMVVEMNNSSNRIIGISVVKNRIKGTHIHNIHADRNYNRYSYSVIRRISIDDMSAGERQVVTFLESVCFKGKTHIKRGQGMSKINERLFNRCRALLDVPLFVKKMFRRRETVTESESESKSKSESKSESDPSPCRRIRLVVRRPEIPQTKI